jgi:RES domain-containing protein
MSSAQLGPQPPQMSGLEKLDEAIRQAAKLAAPMQGVAFRFADLDFAGPTKLLNGSGSKGRGGHWSPRGIAAACASRDPDTAMAEVQAHNRYYKTPVEEGFPLAIVAFRFRLQRALDLFDERVETLLLDFLDRMAVEDWREAQRTKGESTTQAVGRLAWKEGVEALVVPSYAIAGGVNIVVFPDRLLEGSMLEIINPEKLSRLP